MLFFTSTLTSMLDKGLEQWLKNKGNENRWKKKNENFIAEVRKMRNASGQQGENERQWKNKSEQEHKNMFD